MAKNIKRDLAILLSPAAILIALANIYKQDATIQKLSLLPIPLLFIVFIIRVWRFGRNYRIKCEQCQGKCEKYENEGREYIVCHNCRLIYKVYQRSGNPDKIFDEVELKR